MTATRLTAVWLTALAVISAAHAGQAASTDLPPRLRELLEAREYSAAEQETLRLLELSPLWDRGHLLLGQLQINDRRHAAAAQSATAALNIRPSLDGYVLLGLANMHVGRLNESIDALEKAARLKPDHPEIYRILGIDYALGGELLLAEKALATAARLAPDGWEHQYLHGRILFELKRAGDALRPLRRAVELKNASVRAWTALGQAEERAGTEAAAESAYRRAIDSCGDTPDCAWPLLQLAFRHTQQADFAGALPLLRRAVAVRPDWARTHFHLAKTLVQLDDLEAARREFEIAVQLDDTQSEYHYQLAVTYRRLHQFDKAQHQLARYRDRAAKQASGAETDDLVQR